LHSQLINGQWRFLLLQLTRRPLGLMLPPLCAVFWLLSSVAKANDRLSIFSSSLFFFLRSNIICCSSPSLREIRLFPTLGLDGKSPLERLFPPVTACFPRNPCHVSALERSASLILGCSDFVCFDVDRSIFIMSGINRLGRTRSSSALFSSVATFSNFATRELPSVSRPLTTRGWFKANKTPRQETKCLEYGFCLHAPRTGPPSR